MSSSSEEKSSSESDESVESRSGCRPLGPGTLLGNVKRRLAPSFEITGLGRRVFKPLRTARVMSKRAAAHSSRTMNDG